MSILSSNDKQKICDDIIQLESALDHTLQQIFECAGDRIKPDDQTRIHQEMATTKQLLERLRTRYESEVNSSAIPNPSELELMSNPHTASTTHFYSRSDDDDEFS
ncbi:MAG: hypothetical protein WCA35_14145 [Kovacikia sp.]